MVKEVTQKEVDRARSRTWMPKYDYRWYEVDEQTALSVDLHSPFEGGTVMQITFGDQPLRFFIQVLVVTYD